jgi:probable HAF family extracellular repeat protein
MNEHGDVTGVEVRNSSGMESAFRFSDGLGKVDLGTLGGPRSSGMSINNDGVVVGWSEAPIEPGYSWSARAFRARPGLPMEDLGTLVDGHFAVAASINDAGAIVGWSDTSWGARTAFVHTDAGGMVDLRSRMPATTDWPTLVSGIGINNSGQVAVLYDAAEGYGSFRLTPVADTHPPVVSATVAPAVLTPINLRMVTVNVAVTATDDYDPAPVCAIAHIANDEAWSLSSDFDVQITGPLTASLRAFRFPWGDGRTYTITVRCTDVSANAGTADVVVTVPRNRSATR